MILLILISTQLNLFAQSAEEFWKTAVKETGENNFGFAIFCFAELTKKDPRIEKDYLVVSKQYPGFFFYRGFAKFGNKDYKGCIQDMSACLEVKYHDSVNVFMFRAKAKGILEDFYGSLKDINIAIQLSPKAGPLYHLRALTKLQLGDKVGACLDWSKAGELGYYEAYDHIKKFCN